MQKKFLLWDNPCQAIYMLMFVLLILGGINVCSASYVTARDQFGSPLYYMGRYFVFALGGFIAMQLARKAGYRRLLKPELLWCCYVGVVALLIAVNAVGTPVKGATRWLYVGPLSVQPSECAKLIVIMLAAYYLGQQLDRGQRVSLFRSTGLWVAGAAVISGFLIYRQPDLGTAAIVLALMLGMFIIAGLPFYQMFVVTGCAAFAAVFATILSPYRLARVQLWFDPWTAATGDGYQMVQSFLAIGSGGLTGTTWGQGSSKFFYLPEAHTDFAFAIFCQENGFIGAVVVMVIFALLGLAFCSITLSSRDHKGFLLAGGITFLIIGQAFANMAMVCGILPVIGVPLIFISYGGSSMLISMTAIGLLLSVYDAEKQDMRYEALSPEARREEMRSQTIGRWRAR